MWTCMLSRFQIVIYYKHFNIIFSIYLIFSFFNKHTYQNLLLTLVSIFCHPITKVCSEMIKRGIDTFEHKDLKSF